MEPGKKQIEEKVIIHKFDINSVENTIKPDDIEVLVATAPKDDITDTNCDTAEKTIASAEEKRPFTGIEAIESVSAAPMFWIDSVADKISDGFHNLCVRLFTASSNTLAVYRNSRKAIGIAVLSVFVLSAAMFIIFDKFTVYEYAYNGKVLGYVDAQEEVTNVLAVAGEQLNEINTDSSQEIEFVANDNISFKRVVSTGIDTDDADTTVNKLAYMTDIEVAASGIYDGDRLVTIVKDRDSAERLLAEVKATLGTPDEGMEVVSVEFNNQMDIREINVLLTSVQSNYMARRQMTEGGETKFYHLVEEDETLASIASLFGVDRDSIYDEKNQHMLTTISRGDKVCIRKTVEPVSVEMVETGRLKEIIPFETVKKKSKKYYIGDEVVGTKGVDGVQIFEGTLTKVAGKIVDRETHNIEVITEKVDKVILVGTKERPKTMPTGTFINPLNKGTYTITSRPGWRWGRTHEGVDMACSVGTAVHASDGGTIIRAGYFGGYGLCVDIQHDDGWISRYGHLNSTAVKAGDKVYQGQYIADSGNSGRSTGPHLHFETRHNGAFVDPEKKIKGGL